MSAVYYKGSHIIIQSVEEDCDVFAEHYRWRSAVVELLMNVCPFFIDSWMVLQNTTLSQPVCSMEVSLTLTTNHTYICALTNHTDKFIFHYNVMVTLVKMVKKRGLITHQTS